MSFERVHRSGSQTSQTSWSTSQFAPRPFPVQEPKRPPTQEELENQAFQQNKFEATGLQLKEKCGTITPVEQERLGMLQAKMDSFWAQRMERAKAQPNLLEILIRNARSAQASESVAPVQPKLTIGQPNDQYEQEADRVAEQVMSMAAPATPNIQRGAALPEEEEVQTKPLPDSITPLQMKSLDHSLIQREDIPEEAAVKTKLSLQRAPDGSFETGSTLENQINTIRGGGSSLSKEVQSYMEPRFGFNFSQVRVRTDAESVQMNRQLNTQDFAHGSDIYFGSRKSPDDRHLLAHELAHVVQQRSATQNGVSSGALVIQRDGEREPPRPVGFGQDKPETYEPAFMKDALPGVGKVFRGLASLYGWMTIYHVAKEASRQKSFSDVLQVIISAGLLGGLLRADAAAEILPQSWLIALAQREVSSKGPLARQHLDHYLAGSGSDFVEDVAALYQQDDGFKINSEMEIRQADELSGQFKVPQLAYSSPEWQYALGAVDEVHYKLLSAVDDVHAEVSIRIRDNYEWHPDEYRGWGSHIAHVALENAKQNGAKNFWEVGQAIVRLSVGKELIQKLMNAPAP